MIYFIQAADGTGPIKIGVSIRPEKRLEKVQTFSPVRLQIIKTFKGGNAQELAIHHRFAHLRLHGEWFSPASELLDFINNPDEVLGFLETVDTVAKRIMALGPTKQPETVTNEARRLAKIQTLIDQVSLRSV